MSATLEVDVAADAVFEAARHLPPAAKLVLIEKLAGSLLEDDTLEPEVIATAERRWAEIEAGTAKSVSLADLEKELRTKYQSL